MYAANLRPSVLLTRQTVRLDPPLGHSSAWKKVDFLIMNFHETTAACMIHCRLSEAQIRAKFEFGTTYSATEYVGAHYQGCIVPYGHKVSFGAAVRLRRLNFPRGSERFPDVPPGVLELRSVPLYISFMELTEAGCVGKVSTVTVYLDLEFPANIRSHQYMIGVHCEDTDFEITL